MSWKVILEFGLQQSPSKLQGASMIRVACMSCTSALMDCQFMAEAHLVYKVRSGLCACKHMNRSLQVPVTETETYFLSTVRDMTSMRETHL